VIVCNGRSILFPAGELGYRDAREHLGRLTVRQAFAWGGPLVSAVSRCSTISRLAAWTFRIRRS